METQTLLDIRHITKTFPGVTALDDVSFQVKKGEIHALVGENGAGKSTLIKILSGITKATKGEVFFDGEKVDVQNPLQAQKIGIGVVHQELKLVETLSIAENIFLGRPRIYGKLGLVSKKKQREDARALLTRLNASLDETQLVQRLSVAQKQLVEICKALSLNSRLIIMDEPSATLTEKELVILFDTLNGLKRQGVTIIYISHRLEEIFELADRVTVLRDGRVIDTLPVCSVDRKRLIEMMVGRTLEKEYPKQNIEMGGTLLEVKNLCRKGSSEAYDLTLREGEILGIAGLVGAGRTELIRAIFAADKKSSGKIFIRGKETKIQSVSEAIRHRMALVPEERKTQGLVLDMSVKENISMVGIDRILRWGLLNRKKESDLAKRFIRALNIVTPDETRQTKNLSGGNQQKVVLSKWLAVDADILLFDEPTRGIDVGAKAEIYNLLSEFASQKKGIIMVSSEMPELIGMCDRIMIMHEGRITGEILAKEATQEIIMEYATRKA